MENREKHNIIKTVIKCIFAVILTLLTEAAALIAILFITIGILFPIAEDEIGRYDSPEGTYTVIAYRINGGATTAWSVKCVLKQNNKKLSRNRIIYTHYRCDSVETEWLDDDTVIINGEKIENVLKDRIDIHPEISVPTTKAQGIIT